MNLDRKFFKNDAAFQRFENINPKLQEIALDAIEYALKIGVENPIITETFTTQEEDVLMNRVSSTHREGRAFDFRVIDWNGEQIDAMLKYLTDKYNDIGAVTSSGERVVALYHDNGHGPHFHIQLDKTFEVKNLFLS